MKWVKKKSCWKLLHLLTALMLALSLVLPCWTGISEYILAPASASAAVKSSADLAAEKKWSKNLKIYVKQNVSGDEKWVKVDNGSSLKDGANVKAELDFTIPANSLAADGTVTYQFPNGLKLDKEQQGLVTDTKDSSKVIGDYTITKDGKVTIVFNNNFDPAATQDGKVTVMGTLENSSTESDKQINFPGTGTTITVKKREVKKDLTVKKTSQVSSDKKKVDYTVTVLTKNGSPSKIDLNDQIQWIYNASSKYDPSSFKIIKKDAAGKATELGSDYKPQIDASGNGSFTIKQLPELGKGESYVLTYSVDVTPKDGSNGQVQLNNSIEAESGGQKSSGTNQNTVSNSLIDKYGNYVNGGIDWTITVNNDRRDISGYQLEDALPDKLTLDDDVTIQDVDDGSQSSTALKKLIVKGHKGDNKIQLDFSKLPDALKKHSFKITYKTKTDSIANGTKVTNKADFTGEGHKYSGSSETTVNKDNPDNFAINKQFDKEEKLTADEQRYEWHSDLTLNGGKMSTLTYEDEICNASKATDHDDHATDCGEGTHYAVASELYQELTDKNNQKLTGDSDYVLGKDYTLELTCYDKDGQVVKNTDSKTPVKKFKIKLTAANGKTLTPTKYTIHYSTHAKVSEAKRGETWTYYNKGILTGFNEKKLSKSSWANYGFTVKKHINKEASKTGNNGSYQSKPLSADFDVDNGKIYYCLFLTVDQGTTGPLEVTDILPKGLTYVDGSLTAGFGGDQWSFRTSQPGNESYDLAKVQKPVVSTEKTSDGQTKLKITVPAGYDAKYYGPTIQLRYAVSYLTDSTWKDMTQTSKTYVNTASYKGDTDSQTTTVKRNVPVVAKTGEQVKDANGNLTNEVAYQININPAAKDLNPDDNTVTLTDQLKMRDGMQAYLNLKQTKLYQYDPLAKDHIGKELNASLYSLKYDSDSNQLKLELPDDLACVLVYRYSFDSGDNINPTVANTASLAGNYSSKTSTKLSNSESSATITAKKVTIYKIDADHNSKTLPGAQFSLEKLTDGSWSKIASALTSDQDGKVTIADLDNNAVYRIKETKAPDGYSLNKNYYYLVWMDGKKSKSDIYDGLSAAAKKEIGNQKNVHFFESAGGSIYVPDSYSQLKVSKTWLNHDGTTGDAGAEDVTVHLYRAPKKMNSVKVEVKLLQPWESDSKGYDYDWQVAKGSTVSLSWEKSGQINDGGLASVMVNGIDQKLTPGSKKFTSSALNQDTKIVIKSKGWMNSPDVTRINPQMTIDKDNKTLVDTVKLSSANNWQYVWSDLPQEDKDGNSLVYFVEEEAVPGYTSSYRNNNGIKNGEITILNQAKGDNFTLPHAGASGVWAYVAIGVSVALTGLAFSRKEKNL